MKTDLWQQRNYKVIESNDLVRYSRFDITTQQFKILCYCISRIKPGQEDFEMYNFDLRELCEICGISINGKNYANFKDNIEKLANITFWWETKEKDTLCRFFDKVEIYKKDTMVSIKINDVLKPHLLNNREDFTEYLLENVLVMKSSYSIHLYRLLKSYAYIGEYKVSVMVLKEMLQCADDYERYNNFKVRVLDKAIDEINLYTDLVVSYKPLRTSRTITGLHFTIGKKESEANIRAMLERGVVLNRIENEKNQMRIEGFRDEEEDS